MFAELDVVALTHDIEIHGLREGSCGTIVHLYKSGEAFEVEFIDNKGDTVALIPLTPRDVRLVWSKALHSRIPYSTQSLSETKDEEKYWDSKKYAKSDPVSMFDQPFVWF